MSKPTKPQLAALRKIAAHPNGTFWDQFPGGADARMRGRMMEAGWITYPNKIARGHTVDGYRLTDAGREILRKCGAQL